MLFEDRADAGRQLARAVDAYRHEDPVVLGLPRGGVPVAFEVARRLRAPLDVILVRKLGAPRNPELAIGAVAETGEVLVDESFLAEVGIPRSYAEEEARRQLAVIRERRRRYTPDRPPADPADRVVIVIDDGVATGSTMAAALELVRASHPRKLVAAMAVAPSPTVAKLSRKADEVVCLATPEPFIAVSRFFGDFRQVSDAEVIAVLADHAGARIG